ncbi:MAG TPA: carboxymuconolactone decarboxylase family protein [Gemmatimonadaceae bacterium]|nr:carboxymuconolactone decarboxylase family protein [Gemmatimonadaceae bacterium]
MEDSLVHLVRIAGAIAGANENTTRTIMERAVGSVDPKAVDEVIIQSYLFCGFPRTLNAARTWRAISGEPGPASDPSAEIRNSDDWERQGEQTCEIVYGESYQLLRENIRKLHPALDSWMITDGYGKVLSRPQLDLPTRELCIVAACAATGQQRQLHSHLHGALNSGVSREMLSSALDALASLIGEAELAQCRSLLSHVLSKRHPPKRSAPASDN